MYFKKWWLEPPQRRIFWLDSLWISRIFFHYICTSNVGENDTNYGLTSIICVSYDVLLTNTKWPTLGCWTCCFCCIRDHRTSLLSLYRVIVMMQVKNTLYNVMCVCFIHKIQHSSNAKPSICETENLLLPEKEEKTYILCILNGKRKLKIIFMQIMLHARYLYCFDVGIIKWVTRLMLRFENARRFLW